MYLHSVYKFYQAFFGYSSDASVQQRLKYAWAVRDCTNVLKEVHISGSLDPISDYEDSRFRRELASRFLRNAVDLATRRFDVPLKSLEFIDHEIEVNPGRLIMGRKRSLIMSSPLLWCSETNEAILLTFGPIEDMNDQIGVFRVLTEDLSIEPLPVKDVRLYTYWNLRDGLAQTIEGAAASPISVNEIIAVCNRILATPTFRPRRG